MNGKENSAELVIMSVVMIVLSILGIIAGFSRGLFGGIDGLLILGVVGLAAFLRFTRLGIALRASAHSSDPAGILLPTLLSTACALTAGIVLAFVAAALLAIEPEESA